jgi:SAM-dependent methyltransferase
MDLHQAFRDPGLVGADELVRFLEHADQLDEMRAVQRELRRALDLRPGSRVLDAGCGIGLEAARLAAEHPETHVTGLDLNAELLEIARLRTAPNLTWLEADLTALDLPDGSYDAIRTERVLMHVPDLERVLDEFVRLLRPGGRLALFELDYGGMMLAPGDGGEALMRHAEELLCQSLPQPFAGRRIAGLLTERGLLDVAATPFALSVDETIWQRIVADTLSGAPALEGWLHERGEAVARGEFVAAFPGVVTAARQRSRT